MLIVFSINCYANHNWWPKQKKPNYVIRCIPSNPGDKEEMNLIQSLSGLAAQSLNQGIAEEGIWVETSNNCYKNYYKYWIERLHIKDLGRFQTWEIVKRFKEKGVLKGYILYNNRIRNQSINAATVQAGLLKGILIDINQESKAKSLGLKKLYDACNIKVDRLWFENRKSKLNNNLICLINPSVSNNRDYAIANKSMIYYGVDSLLEEILEWVKPLSPVIGWNCGMEFQHIEPCTRWGLINTATDWCMNLSMLSVQGNVTPVKLESINPNEIIWDSNKKYHSFVMSDGDNIQWTMGNFIDNPDYWSNEYNEKIPMSYTSCIVNLSMISPDALNYMMAEKPKNVSITEYGGGYYYPDLFASKRNNRYKLLRELAKNINFHLNKLGVRTFGFICYNSDSETAHEAYKIFSEELNGIVGMISVQYVSYNGGHGKIYWIKNKRGFKIPIVTAKMQIWAGIHHEGSGSPSVIANEINSDTCRMSWTIVHAWSRFKIVNREIIDVSETDLNGIRGISLVHLCKNLLNDNVFIVPIEELLWRIRMEHDKKETKRAIRKFN
jgi:hypothetical protein